MKAGGKSGGDCTLLDGSGGMEAGKRGSGGADGQTVRRSDGQTVRLYFVFFFSARRNA